VMYKPAVADNASLDPVAALVQALAESVEAAGRLPTFTTAAWTGTTNNPIWDPTHLREKRQFSSLLTFTFTLTN
jgi:hypothetical protein